MSGQSTHHGPGAAAHEAHMDPATARAAATLGIWTFLATEVLLFGGLFTAYVIFRIKYPQMFYEDHLKLNRIMGAVNTIVLICSSLTVALGIAAIRRGRQRLLRVYLALTILLAATFLVVKYFEYMEDFTKGLFPSTDIFFSLYFMMTGLHAVHVTAGVMALTVMLVLAFRGTFSEKYHTPVEVTGLYWHFVDLVWIYLLPLLYLVG
jgi:cytochrome c oxidase subunit III